jgi:hypothetical protein
MGLLQEHSEKDSENNETEATKDTALPDEFPFFGRLAVGGIRHRSGR